MWELEGEVKVGELEYSQGIGQYEGHYTVFIVANRGYIKGDIHELKRVYNQLWRCSSKKTNGAIVGSVMKRLHCLFFADCLS